MYETVKFDAVRESVVVGYFRIRNDSKHRGGLVCAAGDNAPRSCEVEVYFITEDVLEIFVG